MKKINNWLFFIFIFFFLVFVIYSYRAIFLTPYDNSYLRDLYDHSQWNMAISKRPVSDNIVYQVTAYDLVHNWSFFKIDPQTPVLGKYLYGYSISIFKNAETISILVLFLSMIIFYQISKLILRNDFLAKLSLFLFTTEPIIFYQISQSMLDLPQLFFLLVHVLSILKLDSLNKKSRSFFWLITAGLSLGGFISIKIGFFSATIIIADLIFLYKNKKVVYLLPIILLSFFTYIFSYFPYFLMGHSLIEFLKNQKWIIVSYWLSSKSKPVFGMVLLSLFTGFIKGLYQGSIWERVKEWSIFWLFYGYFFVKLLLNKKNYLDIKKLYLVYLILGLIFLYSIVPFSARYLVLVIPLLIILSINFIAKLNPKFVKFIALIFIIQIVFFLYPGPQDTVTSISQVWKNGTYQDLYSFIDNKTKKLISRNEFWRRGQLIEKNLEILDKKVQISISRVFFPWTKKSVGDLKITYITPLGEIVNNKNLDLIKQDNVWKIVWKDDLLLSDFNFGDEIIFEHYYGKFGKLISKNGKILSQAVIWPVFFVTHQKIKDESTVQNQLIKLTSLKKHDIEYLYKANMQPDWEVKIGILKPQLLPSILTTINLDPAVNVKYQTLRVHNREYLIKYPNLDPILGGEIILKKKNGTTQLIIKKSKVNGQNVSL